MSVARGGYMPQSDGALLSFAEHMHSVLVLDPTGFGTTTGDVTALNTKVEDFAAKMALVEPSIRNKTAVAAKNTSRESLKVQIRFIANQVYSHAGITDEQLTELGLTVRKQPTPIPAPSDIPDIDVKSVNGRTVTIRVHNGNVLVRRKPEGVATVSVFAFFGEEPSPDPTVWQFMGASGRTEVVIPFGPSDSASTVWLTAYWANAKGDPGPGCQPVRVDLPASTTMEIVSKVKKAA